jgi:hypothetical protein
MGRVTITEPNVGDSLTVTDINATLTSFNTEASDVDGENVHDQSLDNFNFAEEVVTERFFGQYRSSSVIEFRESNSDSSGFAPQGGVAGIIFIAASQSVNFDDYAFIARLSMGVVAKRPNNSSAGSELKIKFYLSYKSSLTNNQYKAIPATTREIELSGAAADDQISPYFLLQSVSLAHHMNRSISGTHSDFILRLNIVPSQTESPHKTEYVQVRELNLYVDTIKR